jgi:hypothetical protein
MSDLPDLLGDDGPLPVPAADRRLTLFRDFASSLSSLLPGPHRVHAVLGHTFSDGQAVRVLLSHPGGVDELAYGFVPSTTAGPCVVSVMGVRAEAVSPEGVERVLRGSLAAGGMLAHRVGAWRSVLPP